MAILPGWRHLPPPSQSQVAATLKRNHRRLWKVIIYMNWWTHPPPPPPPSSLLPSSQPPEHTTAQLGSLFPRICTISSARLPLHSALIRRGGGLNRRWFIRLKFDFFFFFIFSVRWSTTFCLGSSSSDVLFDVWLETMRLRCRSKWKLDEWSVWRRAAASSSIAHHFSVLTWRRRVIFVCLDFRMCPSCVTVSIFAYLRWECASAEAE